MSRTKSFIRGFASTTAQKVITKIIGLIVTPIVLTYLDKTEYGIWVIIGSVLGYMGLMDFGITGAISVIIAKNNTKDKEEHINIIINNAFLLQSLIGLFIILIGVIISFYFYDFFDIDNYSKDDAWIVFIMAVIGYGISFPSKSLKGLIKARQMISLAVWLEFFMFISVTSLNLYFLHLQFGLLALPLGTIIIRLLSYPIYMFFAKRAYPKLKFSISYISLDYIKDIFNVSSIWFIGMIAAMVIYSTDTILIGKLLDISLVTIYTLTFRLSEVFREFIYSISLTLMPAIGQIMGMGDMDKARKIYLSSQPLILSLAIVASIFVFLFNSYFVSFWVGDSYFAGEQLSLVFAIMLFTTVVFHSSSLILSADLRIKEVTTIRLLEAFINIVLTIWFLKLYGLIGAAIATLISSILTSFWYIPYLAMKHLQISFKRWFNLIIIKILKVLVSIIFLSIIVKQLFYFGNLGVFISFILYGVISLLILWLLTIDEEIKRMIYKKIKR